MSGGSTGGVAQSVKQRLLNLSAARGETFNILLMRYGVERLLYRLTQSPHADAFVLKGAMLCRTMSFDGALLASAVGETISRRQTILPDDAPVGLSESFGADAMKQAQWAAFLRKTDGTDALELATVIERLREFLTPMIDAVRTGRRVPKRWPPGGPWS